MEEGGCSLWHLLPHDILLMIIERLDFIECHCVSAVCGNWRSCCKTSKSFLMPKDTIPWLMTRKSRENKPCDAVIKLYRPSTNKTYKIVLPEIKGMVCLYSKDGWLLLYKLKPYKYKQDNLKLCLLNPFSMDKMELPELKSEGLISMTKGTFSTHLKCPDCVIVTTGELTSGVTFYVWKKGNDTWKEKYVQDDRFSLFSLSNIWLCDDQLYCFTKYRQCFAFDTDLNFKRRNSFRETIDMSHNMTVYKNELFAFSMEDTLSTSFLKKISNVYKFDRFIMDWVTDDDGVSNMIWFNNRFNDDIGLVVREDCTDARRSVFLNGLKLHGCQIKPSSEEVHFNTSGFKFVYAFTMNNMLGLREHSFMEREQQRKSREQKWLLRGFRKGEILRKGLAPFIVYGRKQGIWNWVNVA
ncbi:hypothetical protein AQUCO_02700281v1 [Aquilegia coerulea]|uniref:Uncharacterized protein n=1 Tax=Aquilegia coerulea TaxID=218851 RepID=A0A2G5D659_AQUCA|nr:hypothetical protein AQUCO_02700281v1 [Aquilegia coerulea]